MDQVPQPTHLDDPKFFLIFTMEDVGFVIAGMGLGIVLHAMGYTLIAALGVSYINSKFRGSIPEGRMMHMAYWFGFSMGRWHSMINPFARKFVG